MEGATDNSPLMSLKLDADDPCALPSSLMPRPNLEDKCPERARPLPSGVRRGSVGGTGASLVTICFLGGEMLATSRDGDGIDGIEPRGEVVLDML